MAQWGDRAGASVDVFGNGMLCKCHRGRVIMAR